MGRSSVDGWEVSSGEENQVVEKGFEDQGNKGS